MGPPNPKRQKIARHGIVAQAAQQSAEETAAENAPKEAIEEPRDTGYFLRGSQEKSAEEVKDHIYFFSV